MTYLQSPHMGTTWHAEGQDLSSRIPLHTHCNLDGGRSQELSRFYEMSQQHRKFYNDKTGTLYILPYFVLPKKEEVKFPHPLDIPPLSAKVLWNMRRVSPANLPTAQTFPAGRRVTAQERENRDSFFEYRG
ncbi:PREDICTED: UPF0573 protein C2orf70 homolog [Chaetura pelagica]|uniref:UPF0573 protein C2orf70 homolog n=1 Tax=Chaetura pelagica TaxID=8897 RepID=UPI000523DADE|nr:PREDICTED: UPF0573 protein C2orf70 homolog [Chaetura pelagica]